MTTIFKDPKLLDSISERGMAFGEGHVTSMMHYKKDCALAYDWTKNAKIWKYPRVSFDTFIDSPTYLGIGKFVYPGIRKICN